MNKILNWTLGSFFRTIGRVLCYAFLTLLVYFLLSGNETIKNIIPNFLGFTRVNAAENLSYSQAYLAVNQCEVNAYPNAFQNCQWDNKNMGSSISFGSSNGHLKIIQFNIKDSGTYNEGNYRFKFSWSINPRDFDEILDYTPNLYLSFNNGTDNYNNTAICVISVGSSSYTMDTICQFGATQKFDHIKLEFEWHCGVSTQCDRFDLPQNISSISMNSISLFEFDSNPTNAINQQTEVIDAGFSALDDTLNSMNDNINNNLNNVCVNLFDKSLISDASSTFVYKSHYYGAGTYTFFSPDMPLGNDGVANMFILAGQVSTGADSTTNGVDKNHSRTITTNNGYITFAYRSTTARNQYNPYDYKWQLQKGSTQSPYCVYGSSTNKIDDVSSSINNLQDTLTDDDVDDDIDNGLDFFNDFNIGSLSTLTQIIVSPFTFLGQLVVGNTDDICFTLKGTQVCLPNGQRMLWNKTLGSCDSSYNFCPSSTGITAFKTFFNLVVGGFLSYKLLLKVFRSVHKALDPTENHIEVLKL